jgi:hypothetical protein
MKPCPATGGTGLFVYGLQVNEKTLFLRKFTLNL